MYGRLFLRLIFVFILRFAVTFLQSSAKIIKFIFCESLRYSYSNSWLLAYKRLVFAILPIRLIFATYLGLFYVWLLAEFYVQWGGLLYLSEVDWRCNRNRKAYHLAVEQLVEIGYDWRIFTSLCNAVFCLGLLAWMAHVRGWFSLFFCDLLPFFIS